MSDQFDPVGALLDQLSRKPSVLPPKSPTLDNPVGTERVGGDTQVTNPTPGVEPVVTTAFGMPMTQRTFDAVMGHLSDYAMAGPITAYHGTPHTFSPEPGAPYGNFNPQMVGSGEGNQSEGLAHYFTDNKAVADWYNKVLSGGDLFYDGKQILERGTKYVGPEGNWAIQGLAGELSRKIDFSPQDVKNYLIKAAKEYDEYKQRAMESGDYETVKQLEGVRRDLAAIDPNKFSAKKGNTYKVQIDHEPHEFLDLAKPLDEQSDHVKNAIKDHVLPLLNRSADDSIYMKGTRGDHLMLDLQYKYYPEKNAHQNWMSESQIADLFRKAGIAGTTTEDGAGAGAVGRGARTYAVWHGNEGAIKPLDVLTADTAFDWRR